MADILICSVCNKPYKKTTKGLYCNGRGHNIYMSWEYINGYSVDRQLKNDKQLKLF